MSTSSTTAMATTITTTPVPTASTITGTDYRWRALQRSLGAELRQCPYSTERTLSPAVASANLARRTRRADHDRDPEIAGGQPRCARLSALPKRKEPRCGG